MDESIVGLTEYSTTTKGTGGVLRKKIEDFIVDEVPLELSLDEGPFTIARITARNWETNRLLKMLSRDLGMNWKDITFAGTKDKRGITSQYFSFKATPERVASISLNDIEVEFIRTSKKPLFLGDLIGNKFKIVVRESEPDPLDDLVSEILENGGFPNFFGVQRFGAVRPITHTMGRLILEGDLEGAVKSYIGDPSEEESEDASIARKAFRDGMENEDCLELFPNLLGFEKKMLYHITKRPQDFHGALLTLPPNLLKMFVHAYQSYIFNLVLSKRIKEGLPINRAVVGDVVIPLDASGLPLRKDVSHVGKGNLERVNFQIKRGRALVAGPLFGIEVGPSEGKIGEIEKKIIDSEKIKPSTFVSPKIRKLSSKGLYREILCPLKSIEHEVSDDTYTLEFQLLKGAYATSLLREMMKVTDMRAY